MFGPRVSPLNGSGWAPPTKGSGWGPAGLGSLRRWLALVAVALAAACSTSDDPKTTPTGDTPVDPYPTDDTTPPPPACDLDARPDYVVSTDPTCGDGPIGGFEPVVEWSWRENPIHPGFHQVVVTPAVVRLTDDAVPDIVFVAFEDRFYADGGALTAIRGDDGTTLWSVTDPGGVHPRGTGGVAVGDLDGDGRPEIVVPALEGLLCVDADGAFEWLAPVAIDGSAMPAIGDLEGDGFAEVIVGSTVFEHDGAVRWTGADGTGGLHPASFPVDVDGDGRLEVVAGNTVYESDGAIRRSDGQKDGKPAVADFDLDGVPEIVVGTGSGEVRVVGLDGAVWWTWTHPDPGGSAPTVADFDGDGAPEIGVASSETYTVIDTDGAILWTMPTDDGSSAMTGSSVFDFDRDGAVEVVYADEQTLWVFDGATGAVELQWDEHSSGTLHEYPVVADVTGDGSADIVVPSNDYAWAGTTGITVFGDRTFSWAPARPIWNQHAYSITNVDDDGGIPTVQAPNWASWNSFRAGDIPHAPPAADLAVAEPAQCTDECAADLVYLWIPVENRGALPSEATTVTLSRLDGAAETAITALAAPALDPGDGTWLGPVAVRSTDYGADGLAIDVAPAGVDCDPADDRWVSPAFPCPSR
ncbi:MAG: FG-GAP-like repeat-containing protein [Myxococcota bacterium]